MNKIQRLSEIKELVKKTFDFADVKTKFSYKKDNLCCVDVEVTFDGSYWKVTEFDIDSPNDEIIYLVKLALFNDVWKKEYLISPQTKIINTIINEFNLNEAGYFVLENTLYEECEDGKTLDELTDTSKLKKLSVKFDESGDVDKMILITSEGRFSLSENGTEFKPAE